MLKNSRVSSILDVNRLGKALARPGMDTRVWVSLAVVTKVVVDPSEGAFADVLLMPSNIKTTVRVGQEYAGNGFGFYTPIEVDDEVLVEAPNGNPDSGLILTRRLYSASDPPPSEAVANPTDVLLVIKPGKTLRLITKGEGNLVVQAEGSGQVRLGNESASESVIKGNAYRSAEDTWFAALMTFAGSCTTSNPPFDLAALTLAKAAFDIAASSVLSSKVKTS